MSEAASTVEETAPGWRLKLGIGVFVLSIILPVGGIPMVTTVDLSGPMTASVSGALLVTAEVLGILAVAIMGKPGYLYIKSRVLGLLKRYGPPEEVSRTRYRVGLVMFCIPVLFGWLVPYVQDWIPGFASNPLPYAIGGDLLLVMSLFVLGGDFWDKVRALFVHSDKICSLFRREARVIAEA